jgi:hypothetical protein
VIVAYVVLELELPLFLTWNLEGVEPSASCPSSNFTSGKVPDIHCIGGWVCPRTDLGAVENKKVSAAAWKQTPTFVVTTSKINYLYQLLWLLNVIIRTTFVFATDKIV